MQDLQKCLRELEDLCGRFLVQCQVGESGEILNPVFADFGPGDLVINVWNCCAHLARAVRTEYGFYVENLPVRDYPAEIYEWMLRNIEAAGGAINWSGQYPIVLEVPEYVRAFLEKVGAFAFEPPEEGQR